MTFQIDFSLQIRIFMDSNQTIFKLIIFLISNYTLKTSLNLIFLAILNFTLLIHMIKFSFDIFKQYIYQVYFN